MVVLLVLLATVAGAWYLLIVRPQREQQTRHGRLVERLQVGDHVLTVGGIYGRVLGVTPTGVDLELGPGTVTRIATDGIARIVHEAHMGSATTSSSTPSSLPDDGRPPVTAMQQDQHPQHHSEPATSGYVAPPVPAFSSASSVPDARPHAPVGHTTYRAHVVDQAQHHQQTAHAVPSAPVLRPWADVAPVGAPPAVPQHVVQPHRAPQPHHVPQAQPQPMPAFGASQWAAPQQQAPAFHHAPPQQTAPSYGIPPVPQIAFPPRHAQPQPHQVQPAYHQPPAAPVAHPYPQPQPQLLQGFAPHVQHQTQPVPAPVPQPEADPATRTRRHSQAPQGMGSTLRLDDPSLTEPLSRARIERSELAQEYRRMTAPLVDIGPADGAVAHVVPAAAPAPAGLVAPPAPQHVAAPQLFAHPAPTPGAAPNGGVPRPNVPAGTGPYEPAFQRRSPLAAQVATPVPNVQEPSAALA